MADKGNSGKAMRDARTRVLRAAVGLSDAMRRQATKTRAEVRDFVKAHSGDAGMATNAAEREKVYSAVLAKYRALADAWGATMDKGVERQNEASAKETARALPKGRNNPKPLTKEQKIVALNGRNVGKLVAVATENMGEHAVRNLRSAAVETFRRAKVEGWSDHEIQKHLQEAWDERAGDQDTHRFVDSRGRSWSNAAYLQMLTRTTLARIDRNAQVNTLVGNGCDLARISEDGGGDVCEACARWEGKVVSLTGATKGFPTLADAEADGLFHPNCVHRVEYLDEDEIEDALKQSGQADAAHKAAQEEAAEDAQAAKRAEGEMPATLSVLQLGKRLGGHSGADATKASDNDGNQYVVKTSGNIRPECLKNEARMDAFYRAAGIAVPQCEILQDGGKTIKVARFIDGGTELSDWWRNASQKERDAMKAELRKGFAADCLLGNWDVAGATGDNILIDKSGKPWRIDNGGAGPWRATGVAKKPEEWKNGLVAGGPVELFTMANSGNNAPYFGGIKPEDVCREIARTDWSGALAELDPSTRKVVEERIDRCRELDRLQVLESRGVKKENVGMFLEGCRNYGAGAYTEARMNGALWLRKPPFDNPEKEMDKRFWADQKKRYSALDMRAQQAANDYTDHYYSSMNAYFRAGEQRDKGRAESFVKTIAAEPNKGDIWLQRGGRRSSIVLGTGENPPDVKALVGKTWTDKGFMSCSPVKGGGFSGNLYLNIYCPDGAKMIFARQFSRHKSENEMTLQAGSRFVITKAEEKDGIVYLDLSLVKQTPGA